MTMTFGHSVEKGLHVARRACWPAATACESCRGNLTAIVRLVDLANLCNDDGRSPRPHLGGDSVTKPRVARRAVLARGVPPFPFALWAHPAGSRRCWRDMHSAGLLERFIPEFAHAAGCCNSTSITSTRSMSIVCGRWSSLPRSLWPIAGRSAESTARFRKNICCTWRY